MSQDTFIHRTNHGSGYVKIANTLARDYDTLSAAAFGWLVRLLSLPADWSLNLKTLMADKPGRSRHVIYAVMRELRDAGFVVTLRRRNVGRWGANEYHVFDQPQTAEQIAELCRSRNAVFAPTASGATVSDPTVYGESGHLHRTERYKDRGVQRRSTSDEVDRDAGACALALDEPDDSIDPDTGLTPADLRSREIDEAEARSGGSGSAGGGCRQETFALQAEDEPNGKKFPWPQVCAVLKRIVPEVGTPAKGDRRDFVMAAWWRRHGKTIGCFEELAKRVQESDYLMARNGHKGNNGRPYSWGWIFSKTGKGELRADKILAGDYSSDAMGWVLDAKKESKLTRVMSSYSRDPIMVDLAEIHDGEPRYRVVDTHTNGLPVIIDYKS